jgi:sugar O-acyltransferase (sialic acid O-acetyltransferase NeuD family)
MDLYIVGAGGLGREVSDYICDQYEKVHLISSVVVDGELSFPSLEHARGEAKNIVATVAVGDSEIRKTLTEALLRIGAEVINIVHKSSIISRSCNIGFGNIIGPNVVIGPRVFIGNSNIINVGALLAHDCSIGNYSNIGPNAVCNGAVTVGDFVTLGSNSTIINSGPGRKISIGDRSTVAIGSSVYRSVPTGVTVLGNPARNL